MTKGLPAVAAAAWLTAFGAFAQDSVLCVNDTPPAPSTTGLFCADPGLCPNQVKGLKYTQQVVTYKSVDDAGACDAPGAYCPNRCTDPRASCTNVRGGGQRCRIDLQGILFVPKPAPKSAPAVVLVTGSTACVDSTPGSCASSTCAPGQYPAELFCALKVDLIQHGYVVLAMYPRGYNDSFAASTGLYVAQRVPQQVARGEPCAFLDPTAQTSACTTVNLEDEGQQDVGDAVTYLKSHVGVDPDRIAVIGHSYGGIRTVRFNTIDFGQKAVVAIAPASESWCLGSVNNEVLQTNLFGDVDNAQTPTFFLQPRNDVNLSSTVELSHEAGLNRQKFEAAIYPRVKDPNGNNWTYGDMAHGCFVADQDQVDVWAPTVRDFIGRYGVK